MKAVFGVAGDVVPGDLRSFGKRLEATGSVVESLRAPGLEMLLVGRSAAELEPWQATDGECRALAEALRCGHLGGACLDVTREEPLPADSPLYDAPGLWLTHHTAYRSVPGAHEALSQAKFLANLERFVAGEPLQNLVNPDRGY